MDIPKVDARWAARSSVTIIVAAPLTAASRTISSSGSATAGRSEKSMWTYSDEAAYASSRAMASRGVSFAMPRCSARSNAVSYSSNSAVEAKGRYLPLSAARSKTREAPTALRSAASRTEVSRTTRGAAWWLHCMILLSISQTILRVMRGRTKTFTSVHPPGRRGR